MEQTEWSLLEEIKEYQEILNSTKMNVSACSLSNMEKDIVSDLLSEKIKDGDKHIKELRMKKKNYILGYAECTDDELTLYETATEAYHAEEWCTVSASSLVEAKEEYEEAFDAWKNSDKHTPSWVK